MSFICPKFRAHVKAHKTVIGQERWFHKGQPVPAGFDEVGADRRLHSLGNQVRRPFRVREGCRRSPPRNTAS